MDILATLKEIVAQMEADAAAQVVAAQTEVSSDPAPADPVVEAPVETPVADAPVDDGSAANEPVPEVGADATQDPTPAPEATEQL